MAESMNSMSSLGAGFQAISLVQSNAGCSSAGGSGLRVGRASGLAHRFHRLIHGDQLGCLDRLQKTGRSDRDGEGCRGGVVGKLVDEDRIELAEAVIVNEQTTAQLFYLGADQLAPVLRPPGHGGPGLGSVSSLQHVDGHRTILLAASGRRRYFPWSILLYSELVILLA